MVTGQKLLTREEAAAYLGLKAQTLATWASAKRYNLRYIKAGRCVRYRQADLDRFVESRAVGPVEPATA
jgi:excisionase family DNA binding protein